MPNSIDPNLQVPFFLYLIFFYIFLLIILITGNPFIILAIIRIRNAQNRRQKLTGYLSFLAIPLTFLWYIGINYFENKGVRAVLVVAAFMTQVVPVVILAKSFGVKKSRGSVKKKSRKLNNKNTRK